MFRSAFRQVLVLTLFFLLIPFAWGQSPMALENKIDGIVTRAIQQQAFPGCVVYAARKGKPFFSKAYGHHTYDSTLKTNLKTIYDLASITKVAASTLCIMKLYEENRLDLDVPIDTYVKGLGSAMGSLTIRQMLAHQSGLPPGVNFLNKLKEGGEFPKRTLSYVKTTEYTYRMGRSLYAYHDLYPVIKDYISRVEVSDEKKYKYSGLFFYIVPELVYNLTGQSFISYLQNTFYNPMNAETLTFNAGRKYEDYEIAPTELDDYFRMELVHGSVHDEGAALLRGISGNAGLFGNVEDLAKVWQMLLNDGEFEGTRYLKPSTIHYFTSIQYPQNDNHRGLGFDKILFEYNPELSHYAASASIRSFGHYGFTGIMVWADPDEDLLFILMSNRVHPSRTHNNLKELRIRPALHQAMYDHLLTEE